MLRAGSVTRAETSPLLTSSPLASALRLQVPDAHGGINITQVSHHGRSSHHSCFAFSHHFEGLRLKARVTAALKLAPSLLLESKQSCATWPSFEYLRKHTSPRLHRQPHRQPRIDKGSLGSRHPPSCALSSSPLRLEWWLEAN